MGNTATDTASTLPPGPPTVNPPAVPVIALASDHAGWPLKEHLHKEVRSMGYTVRDLGTDSARPVDYPDFAHALAKAIQNGEARYGVLICGTGIGMAMAANRHARIRAAVCHSGTCARLARAHNNANVLALGERLLGVETALDCLRQFLTTKFHAGRHVRRVNAIDLK